MAEPARKLNDEDEGKKLSALERAQKSWGLSSSSAPDPDELSEAEESAGSENSALDKARDRWGTAEVHDGDEIEDDEAVSTNSETNEESTQNGGEEESLYRKGGPTKVSLRGRILNRKTAVIGGVTGLLIGGTIGSFILFAPILRLESYLTTINQRVFGFASSAVQTRVENLFGHYMVSHILSLERCGGVINNDCKADFSNNNYAAGLFNTWRDAKIEEKLFDKFGIEVETHRNPEPGAPRFTLRDRMGRQVILSEGDLVSGQFSGGNREFGRDIRKFLRDETKWNEVMQRRSVRKYLDRKHGIKTWCFLFCKTRDSLENFNLDAKTRFKYRFVEKFVYPFSSKYGLIMDCIMTGGSGTRCTPEGFRTNHPDRATRIAEEEVTDIVEYFRNNPNQRLSQYIVEKLVARIMNQSAGRAAASAIPIVGQVYLAVSLADMFDRMDGFVDNNGLSKMAADLNASQYLEWYTSMRTTNDEMKSGVLELDEVGAVMEQFEGAEESLVYQGHTQPQASVSFWGGGSASAQGTTEENETYVCANGEPIATGEYVCPEKKIARTYTIEDVRDDKVVDGLTDILNTYGNCTGVEVAGKCAGIRPKTVIRPILGGINRVADAVLGTAAQLLMDGIRHLPGVGSIFSWAESKMTELMEGFFAKVFPLPLEYDSPGREKYDGLEAGGEVAAYEFCKGGAENAQTYGLGCKKLSSEEAAVIQQDNYEQQAYEFKNSSMMARLTSLDYPNSLASQLVMAAPSNLSQFTSKLPVSISNILGTLGGNFSRIFSTPAHAAVSPITSSPFGVPLYGYSPADTDLARNPADFTEAFCLQASQNREASRTEDPVTGFDEYSVTNPCLLEESAVEAARLWFTDD